MCSKFRPILLLFRTGQNISLNLYQEDTIVRIHLRANSCSLYTHYYTRTFICATLVQLDEKINWQGKELADIPAVLGMAIASFKGEEAKAATAFSLSLTPLFIYLPFQGHLNKFTWDRVYF